LNSDEKIDYLIACVERRWIHCAYLYAEEVLERTFEQQLKVKEKGSYQLTVLDIFVVIISVASGNEEILSSTSILLP
jgi:hypothetical protein